MPTNITFQKCFVSKAKLKSKAKETVQPLPTLYSQEVSRIVANPDREEVAAALPTFQSIRENTWLVGNFDIRLWNVHDSSTIRTNNHVEGWHSHLNKIVGKAHPNIFELVDTFKKEQAMMEVDVTQCAVGAAPPRRSRQAVDRDRKIKELKERFEQNRSTLVLLRTSLMAYLHTQTINYSCICIFTVLHLY